MTDEKPEKQIWTSPGLEILDMRATADGALSVSESQNIQGES